MDGWFWYFGAKYKLLLYYAKIREFPFLRAKLRFKPNAGQYLELQDINKELEFAKKPTIYTIKYCILYDPDKMSHTTYHF
jgi:hypothetical protein